MYKNLGKTMHMHCRGLSPGSTSAVHVCANLFLKASRRQAAKGEADRFRVTVELRQIVHGVFMGRMSNIDEFGLFKEDEVYEVKGSEPCLRRT